VGKEQGQGIGVLDAMRKSMGYGEGKKKCSGVKGRLRLVGPCRGLHCGDWRDRGDVVMGKGWVEEDVGCGVP
jgi:hypothetical protein